MPVGDAGSAEVTCEDWQQAACHTRLGHGAAIGNGGFARYAASLTRCYAHMPRRMPAQCRTRAPPPWRNTPCGPERASNPNRNRAPPHGGKAAMSATADGIGPIRYRPERVAASGRHPRRERDCREHQQRIGVASSRPAAAGCAASERGPATSTFAGSHSAAKRRLRIRQRKPSRVSPPASSSATP